MAKLRKAIFLDRDGVINEAVVENGKPYPPLKLGSVKLTDGIRENIRQWHELGYLVIGITNQPDVANNLISKRAAARINRVIQSMTGLDDMFACYHNDSDNCECRKPKIGLLLKAHRKYGIDFSNSYMIGDRWKDIEAGRSAGCKTIFVSYKYNEPEPVFPDYTVSSILELTSIIEE